MGIFDSCETDLEVRALLVVLAGRNAGALDADLVLQTLPGAGAGR